MNPGLMAAWLYDVKAQFGLIENPQTAAYTLSAKDAGTILNVSGTFALQFPSVKAVDRNWSMIIQNTSTEAITVNPWSGETLDTKTSYVMYGGEARLFYKGATEIKSIVMKGFEYAFITVGANPFVTPPGYTTFEGEMWNGGNSGSKFTSGGRSGGAGGSCFPFSIAASLFGATETITVGAGGAAISAVDTGGAIGGISSIGTLLVLTAAAAAGQAALNYISESNIGQATWIWVGSPPTTTAVPKVTLWGGAAGGSIEGSGAVWGPGLSNFAGDGGAASLSGVATAGVAPGGGGGGTATGTSGAGARGEVRIRGKV